MDEYLKCTIENYATVFKPPYESLFVILGREDPNPYMDASARTDEHHQAYLTNATGRFFRASNLAEYWNEPASFTSQAQKVKNILKEKKLSKFFGQRLKVEDIKKQFSFISENTEEEEPIIRPNNTRKQKAQLDHGSDSAEEEEDAQLDDSDDLESDEQSENSDDQPRKIVKKKKADKLTEFFGDRIPKRQLKSQNLVPSSATTTMNSFNNRSSVDVPRRNDIMEESSNTISGEQKLMLSKRTKKLNTYFGEALDEVNIKKHIVEPVKRQMEAAAAANNTVPDAPSPIAVESPISINIASASSSSLSSSASFRTGAAVANPNLRRNSQKNYYISNARKRISSSNAEEEDPEITKMIRRRKSEKLQQFLGERINQKLLEVQVLATKNKLKESGDAGTGKSATRRTKPAMVKKANKLERLFGEIPPTDLILLTKDALSPERRSIISLQILLDNNADVTDLLNFMGSSDAGNVEESATDEVKNARQKRLNKLRSFFGESIRPQELIERHILSYLQESIEEKYSGEDLEKLKEDLDHLRERVRRYSIKERVPEEEKEDLETSAGSKDALSREYDDSEKEPSRSEVATATKPQLQKSMSEPCL